MRRLSGILPLHEATQSSREKPSSLLVRRASVSLLTYFIWTPVCIKKHWVFQCPPVSPIFPNRCDKIRTCDLCVPNAALYQTEPRNEIYTAVHVFWTATYILYWIFKIMQVFFHLFFTTFLFNLFEYPQLAVAAPVIPLCNIAAWHSAPLKYI